MNNDIISIIFQMLALVLSIILSVTTNKQKIWIIFVTLFVIASLIPSISSLVEKKKREKEDILYRYKTELNDDNILDELHKMEIKSTKGFEFSFGFGPTASTYGKDVVAKFIKIPSPMGILAKYKVMDPSKYGLQNITPLLPIHSNDSVFYIGCIAISKEDLNNNNEVPIITRYNNGLIDVEQILIDKYVFNIRKLSNFGPIRFTNKERLLIAEEVAKIANFPPVTLFDEYYGVLEFGNYGNKEKSPSARIRLRNDGGVNVDVVSIPNQSTQIFNKLLKERLDLIETQMKNNN